MNDKEMAAPGLVGLVIDVQSDQDDIIDAIFTHLDVITKTRHFMLSRM